MWFTGRMVADPPPSLVATHGGAQLLTLLRDARPRSRADIAEATGWARKTVESRLEELSSRGLVTCGEARRTGGHDVQQRRLRRGELTHGHDRDGDDGDGGVPLFAIVFAVLQDLFGIGGRPYRGFALPARLFFPAAARYAERKGSRKRDR